jgi:hypothetical protein
VTACASSYAATGSSHGRDATCTGAHARRIAQEGCWEVKSRLVWGPVRAQLAQCPCCVVVLLANLLVAGSLLFIEGTRALRAPHAGQSVLSKCFACSAQCPCTGDIAEGGVCGRVTPVWRAGRAAGTRHGQRMRFCFDWVNCALCASSC